MPLLTPVVNYNGNGRVDGWTEGRWGGGGFTPIVQYIIKAHNESELRPLEDQEEEKVESHGFK